MALCGPIRVIRSDHCTNCVGARKELQEAMKDLNGDKLTNFLSRKGYDFEFKPNTPCSSHMGGGWERQIRYIQNVLDALLIDLGGRQDDETLRTFTSEATAIVNGRLLSFEQLNDP